ncbi:MAG: hypothetical protein WCL06_08055 [Bacteroidota bacterium]
MQKKLFITVNYCQAELTIELLKSLSMLTGVEEVILVVADNSPEQDDFRKLEEYKSSLKHDSLHLYKSPGNIGYFGAVDHVMQMEGISREDIQWLIVSNNDIEIRDKEFFVKLNAVDKNAAVIAPDIISLSTQQHQNPHRSGRISRSQKWQYSLLYSNYYLGYLLNALRNSARKLSGKELRTAAPAMSEIFSAHGAFMIFTSAFFNAGGKIHNDFFLYAEEDSVAAQCFEAGMKILYYPEVVVYHNEHVSTDSSGFKKEIYSLQQNAYRYMKKHYPGFY